MKTMSGGGGRDQELLSHRRSLITAAMRKTDIKNCSLPALNANPSLGDVTQGFHCLFKRLLGKNFIVISVSGLLRVWVQDFFFL